MIVPPRTYALGSSTRQPTGSGSKAVETCKWPTWCLHFTGNSCCDSSSLIRRGRVSLRRSVIVTSHISSPVVLSPFPEKATIALLSSSNSWLEWALSAYRRAVPTHSDAALPRFCHRVASSRIHRIPRRAVNSSQGVCLRKTWRFFKKWAETNENYDEKKIGKAYIWNTMKSRHSQRLRRSFFPIVLSQYSDYCFDCFFHVLKTF